MWGGVRTAPNDLLERSLASAAQTAIATKREGTVTTIASLSTAAVDDDCRELFRMMTAGVAVVTTAGPFGPQGMTASAVMSLSLHPPLIVVCLSRGSGTLRAVRRTGKFGVHLLRDDQQDVAESFARRCCGDERFAAAGAAVTTETGVPTLVDALAWASCHVEQVVEGGDHRLLIGRIVHSKVGTGHPLVWHHSEYRQIAEPTDSLTMWKPKLV